MPASPNPLSTYKILVADSDKLLANVLRMLLGEMGFSSVEVTPSGSEASSLLRQKTFDFLITEWQIQDMDGISLISHIRRDSASPNPRLPIIMLTGRAEQSDVATARDTGINEYVVKPFSAQTIYERLERLIEKPRSFIASTTFVGPDRRHKELPPPNGTDRRSLLVATQEQAAPKKKGALVGPQAKSWAPDFSLMQKLGPTQKLHMLITPEMLDKAQNAINAITADSLRWIKEDMEKLSTLHKKMCSGAANGIILTESQETALIINSRAGTFGYGRAAEVAYKLYLFYRNKFQPDNPTHHVITQKHIEVLTIIFSHNILGMGGNKGAQIAMELNNLVLKYAP